MALDVHVDQEGSLGEVGWACPRCAVVVLRCVVNAACLLVAWLCRSLPWCDVPEQRDVFKRLMPVRWRLDWRSLRDRTRCLTTSNVEIAPVGYINAPRKDLQPLTGFECVLICCRPLLSCCAPFFLFISIPRPSYCEPVHTNQGFIYMQCC